MINQPYALMMADQNHAQPLAPVQEQILPSLDSTLLGLPNELIKKIIMSFDAYDVKDMEALKALGLTCRAMANIMSDRLTMEAIARTHEATAMFPSTTWSPRTLFRVSLLHYMQDVLQVLMLRAWYTMTRPPRLPIRQRGLLVQAFSDLMKMEGVEDKRSDWSHFRSLSGSKCICLYACALLYQEVFMHKWHVVIEGYDLYTTSFRVRSTLKFIFTNAGASVALRILLNPVQGQTNRSREAAKQYSTVLQSADQQLIVVEQAPADHSTPRELWNLGNIMNCIFFDDVRLIIKHHRNDWRLEHKVFETQVKWGWGGFKLDYFGRTAKSPGVRWSVAEQHDLLNCMAMWGDDMDLP